MAEPGTIQAPGGAEGIECSVVLPCLDEARSVEACVAAAWSGLARTGAVGEVLVVDNESTDGSAELARAAGASVLHEPRHGYGAALRAGIGAARGQIIVMADADATYDLRRLGELVTPVRRGDADLVLGSRLGTGSEAMPVLHRRIGTPLLGFLISRTCDGEVPRDTQSGFRAFHRERMLALGLAADGMELASEMLIKASQAGLRIGEVEMGYERRVGRSKLRPLSDGWRHVRLIRSLSAEGSSALAGQTTAGAS